MTFHEILILKKWLTSYAEVIIATVAIKQMLVTVYRINHCILGSIFCEILWL